MDKALSSRFVQVMVTPCTNNWLKWAKENRIHPQVMAYVDSDPEIFTDTDPRSWAKVSSILKASDWEPRSDRPWNDIADAAISGLVGTNRAIGFRGFCNGKGRNMLPKVIQMLGDYLKYQPKIRQLVKEGRVDLLETLVHQTLLVWRNTEQKDRIMSSTKMRRDLYDLIGDLPPDQGNKLKEITWQLMEKSLKAKAQKMVKKPSYWKTPYKPNIKP